MGVRGRTITLKATTPSASHCERVFYEMGYARESEGGPGCLPLAHSQIHRPWAEFLFVPAERVLEVAKRESAIPFDVRGVEFGHHGKECFFDALVKKHGLET